MADDRNESVLYSLICNECEQASKLILEKQRQEGLSILNPPRVFSRVDPETQISVMLDHRLQRIIDHAEHDPEEAEMELMRLLLLKRVARKLRESALGSLKRRPEGEDLLSFFQK